MNIKKIFFNENRTIKKDFENRNISQYSHNVEMIEAYIPKTLLAATSDYYYTVRIAFELANGEAVNDKYMQLDSSYLDNEFYRYKCVLSQGYTKSVGLLKMSIHADALSYADPSNPIIDYSWVSAEFKLNVLKTASSNFEINQTFEAMLAEQVEADIAKNAENILKTNELINLNDSENSFIRDIIIRFNSVGIEALAIDTFCDNTGIDTALSSEGILDGYDSVNHCIDISNKTLVSESLFEGDFIFKQAAFCINYEKDEDASISVAIIDENGNEYPYNLTVKNNIIGGIYLTNFSGNNSRLKIAAVGKVKLLNIAWGVFQYD